MMVSNTDGETTTHSTPSISETALDYLRLSLVRGIGPHTGRQLIRACGSIRDIWRMQPSDWQSIDGVGPKLTEALRRTDGREAGRIAQRCEQLGLHLLCPEDAHYPKALKPLDDAPLLLFAKGDTATLQHVPMLAVVGARRASREGKLVTRRWCRHLSEHGVGIVSGMAYGIDAAAHGGALEGDSPTIAVLGCGIHACSGEQQRQIDAIAGQGCVISEYAPDIEPRPEHFPSRNRIIAGIAEATLVVEAGLKSGSLITAHQALQYGREVLAVPGSVLTGNHTGCHALIRDGATLAESPQDLLTAMHWETDGPGRTRRPAYTPANEEEVRILTALEHGILHMDVLAENCGLTVSALSPILLGLELLGVVESLPGNRYTLAMEAELP